MRPATKIITLATLLFASTKTTETLANPQGDPEPLPPLHSSGQKPDPLEVATPPAQPPPDPTFDTTNDPSITPPPYYTPPPPPKEEGFAEGDHFEFTMGFLGGQRSYKNTSFKFEDGNSQAIGGSSLVEPFVRPPYDNVTVLGLRYEMRLVMSYVRMTAGIDIPFPTYKTSDTARTYTVGGAQQTVSVQSLLGKEMRFGIGGEFPYKNVAFFADLIGGIHWVDTTLSVGSFYADYGATSFAFSGRAGLRAHMKKWFFVTASGEVGIIGDIRWSTDLSVGFSVK